MRGSFHLAIFSVNALSWVLSAVAQNAPAPASASAETPQAGVVLTKLSPPVYPPLARQARIIGEVKVQVSIHKDGGVEATAISGHPMLKEAALDSAQKSQFECNGCAEGTTSLEMTYTFDLNPTKPDPDPCCCSHPRQERPVESNVSQLGNRVAVTVDPGFGCVCPDECTARWAEEHSHYRSLKCLYLWKCGFHQIYIQ